LLTAAAMFSRQHLLLTEVVRHGLLYSQGSRLVEGRRCLSWAGRTDPRFPDASLLAKALHRQTAGPVVAALCLGHLLNDGPKFFEFTAGDCEAQENFSLDLPVEEYGQPFPTLMVKLPRDYAGARVSRIDSRGLTPEAVILLHDPANKVALASVRFRGDNDAGYHLALERQGLTVEQVWEEFRDELNAHAAPPSGTWPRWRRAWCGWASRPAGC
jgi:hypothetical protein